MTPLHELKRLRAAWRANVPLPMNVVLVVAAIYLLLKLVRPVIPGSVILLYMGFAVAGALIHVTLDDARIRRFVAFFVDVPAQEPRPIRAQRWALLAVIPLVLGWWVYDALRPTYAPPVEIFQRHPTVGEEVLKRITIPAWAADPKAWRAEDIAAGKRLYEANCAVCHGDKLDGQGPAAEAFRYPIRPANFTDAGTIGQLTLQYVYWRLTIGGLQNQFNSAMPKWAAGDEQPDASTLHSNDFTPEEAWRVILYIYRGSGFEPRRE
ncbi:MAG: cytochrome c [Ideonella sp.]|nr:cytochrome c [Ideonella sp.]MCC7459558.1 cytochrome c [Nitrospira sp.]